MSATDLTFNITTVVAIVGGIISLIGVWVKLNNKIAIIMKEHEQLKDDNTNNHREIIIVDDKNAKLIDKEAKVLHDRIDRVKEEVKENRIKADKSVSELKSAMQEMELRIIKAIHEIKK